jgi:PAS domain S-box-containing protein
MLGTDIGTPVKEHPDDITILAVDDEPGFVELTAEFLGREDERFTVVTETSASDGIERLAVADIDCVVSDYDMPGMNGIELLRTVREEKNDLPFILFTGKGSEVIASDAISAGVTDYVQKGSEPERYELLANRINTAVSQYRTERQLERQNDLFAKVQDIANVGAWVYHPRTEDAYFSDKVYDIYGVEHDYEAIPEKDIQRFYHPEDRERVREAVRGAIESGERYDIQVRITDANGTDKWVRTRADPDIEDGEVVRVRGTLQDITDRKEGEERLQQYEAIIEALGDGVYAVNEAGEVEYVNERYAEMKNIDREEIIKTPFRKWITDDQIDDIYELVDELERGARDVALLEYDFRTVDGQQFPVEVRFTDLEFPDGERGRAGVVRDITDRKEQERELKKERKFSNKSLDTLEDIFYFVDTNGNFQRWNSKLPELTGYSDDEIGSMNSLEFFEGKHREAIQESIQTILETGFHATEAEITTADGQAIPHEFRGVRMTDTEGNPTGIIGIARDITARKQREERLVRQNERLEEFVSVASHDLRSPLNVADGRLSLAIEECDSEHLSQAANAINRSQELIDDLLTLAREDREAPDVEPVTLADAAEHSWETVDTGAATLEVDATSIVCADRSRLQQIFENLYRNAVEHGGDRVTVHVGDVDCGFYVADTGPGIPEGDREQIFEAGYSTNEDGTGFGLRIVKEIAEAHGWEVTVTECEQSGARFEVTGIETPD